MDIDAAVDHLGELLDVTEDRYPRATRILHMNQSLSEVGREFETRINEGVGNIVFTAGTTKTPMNSLVDENGGAMYPTIIEAAWYCQDYTSGLGVTINEDWKELAIYPNYKSLLNAQEVDASTTGDLVGITTYGDQLYLMNAQTVDTLVRCTFRGWPYVISAGDNRWLREAPWVIIYHTAVLACIWLEDEGRIPVYQRLYEKAAEVVNIEDSMRNNAPMETTEV